MATKIACGIEFSGLRAQYSILKSSIDERIHRVLDHGQFIMGPEVHELEERLARYVGARYCVSVASGTEALLVSLMALGIGPGDEVITTPFSFIATAETIALLGATVVFVDIEPDTCNLDASRLPDAITKKTRAIMPVSLYGQPADMEEINSVAARFGLPVIEDAAQSFGATYRGRRSCALSTIGCTSFFPSKPLGCYGDGGAIFTDDDGLAKAMREIRVHGQERRYHHTRIGVGGRMDTLQCAVVLAKLERFEQEIGQRQLVADRYDELLKGNFDGKRLRVRPDRTSVYAQYTVLVSLREKVQQTLAEKNIPTAVHYPLSLNLQPAMAGRFRTDGVPLAETASRQVISLPMHPELQYSDQLIITTALIDAAVRAAKSNA